MDAFLNDLFNLLKINTIYSNDALPFGSGNIKALNYMLDLGSKMGFKTKNLDNYAGYIEYGFGDEIIGILCHLDVVEVTNNWSTDPFDPIIKDNKIYARGVNDDKGPLMASLYALKELKDEGIIPNKRIRLIMGCNEESGSKCMEYYKKVEEEPTYSFSPDAEFPVIYGEKGILTVNISGKINTNIIKSFDAGLKFNIVPDKAVFELNIDLKNEFNKYLLDNNIKGEIIDNKYIVYGKSTHAMNPKLGINAIDLAFNFIKEYDDIYNTSNITRYLNKYYLNDYDGHKLLKKASTHKEMGELTANLAILHINDNNIEMVINYRLPNENDYKELIDSIDKSFIYLDNKTDFITKDNEVLLNFGNFKKSKLDLKLDVSDYMEIHYVDPNSKLVKSLLKAYQDNTLDYDSKPITIGGGTYAKAFKNSVAFGIKFPNEEEVAHIDNEYESIDSLLLSKKIIKDAIKELLK